MPLYDFVCKDGHITESLRRKDCQVIRCGTCSLQAKRRSVYRNRQIGKAAVPKNEQNFRKEIGLMQEATAEIEHTRSEAEKRTGRKVEGPKLWKQAKENVTRHSRRGRRTE